MQIELSCVFLLILEASLSKEKKINDDGKENASAKEPGYY